MGRASRGPWVEAGFDIEFKARAAQTIEIGVAKSNYGCLHAARCWSKFIVARET